MPVWRNVADRAALRPGRGMQKEVSMRRLIAAAAAGLMALSVLPAAANAAPQERRYEQDHNDRGQDRGRHDDRGRDDRGRGDNDRYGRWENSWGVRPAGPPRSWSRHNDWYRHVRACQMRYRSYNPRTDTYVVRRGRMAQCRL